MGCAGEADQTEGVIEGYQEEAEPEVGEWVYGCSNGCICMQVVEYECFMMCMDIQFYLNVALHPCLRREVKMVPNH